MSKENTIDYLKDIPIHKFPEDMSIYESALETCLLAEANWAYILESTIKDEYESYENILKEEKEEETGLSIEEDNVKIKESFFEKCKEAMRKIASYISGLFSKFVVAMGNVLHKNAFLRDRKSQERMQNGLKNIEDAPAEEKTFSGFILDHGALRVLQNNTKGVNELVKKIGNNEFLNNIRDIDDIKVHLDNGYKAAYIGLLSDNGMKDVIEKNKDAKNSLKNNLIAMLSFNKGLDNGKDQELKYTVDESVYKTCLDNFQNSKFYTNEAKSLYKISKSILNIAINSIDNLKKYTTAEKSNDEVQQDAYAKNNGMSDEENNKVKSNIKEQVAKMSVETLNKIGKLLAQTNGIVLTLLNQDYTTCCKVLLKLYNIGGKSSKKSDTKEESKEETEQKTAATESVDVFGYESIESIFGSTAFI